MFLSEIVSFLPISTKVSAEKVRFFSVIRNEIQKSGFLKHTQTLSFYISLYNYRRIQNKSNSAHSLVGISVRKTHMQTFLANFSHSHIHFDLIYCPMVTFSGILYITLENSLIFTRSHAFCLEKKQFRSSNSSRVCFSLKLCPSYQCLLQCSKKKIFFCS